jgi:hypothetical protein
VCTIFSRAAIRIGYGQLPFMYKPRFIKVYDLVISQVRHRRDEVEYNLDETGWGPWGSNSACTRTCGGGVFYQERVCHSVS